MILFTNKPMLRRGRARGMLLPRPTAVSSRSWRSISGKRESKILASNGGEDTRVSEFIDATLRRRTTRSGMNYIGQRPASGDRQVHRASNRPPRALDLQERAFCQRTFVLKRAHKPTLSAAHQAGEV